jgi:hypothetical protein
MYYLFGRFRGNAINLQTSVYEVSRQRNKTYQK